MILDVYSVYMENTLIAMSIFFLIGICCLLVGASRNSKYKKLPDNQKEKKEKLKHQKDVLYVIGLFCILISALVLFLPIFKPDNSNTQWRDEWVRIDTDSGIE